VTASTLLSAPFTASFADAGRQMYLPSVCKSFFNL
jgi:hypothetical protein